MFFRKLEVKDAEAFWHMQAELDKETKFLMFEPGERSQDLKRVELLIQNANEKSDFLLVAEHNSEIVGFILAQKGENKRTEHRAYIVVGIRAAFQGQGIGTKFFEELDNWAIEQQIKRLELTVMTTNLPAKHLYEKSGFYLEGVRIASMYVNRRYVNEYYMAKIL